MTVSCFPVKEELLAADFARRSAAGERQVACDQAGVLTLAARVTPRGGVTLLQERQDGSLMLVACGPNEVLRVVHMGIPEIREVWSFKPDAPLAISLLLEIRWGGGFVLFGELAMARDRADFSLYPMRVDSRILPLVGKALQQYEWRQGKIADLLRKGAEAE